MLLIYYAKQAMQSKMDTNGLLRYSHIVYSLTAFNQWGVRNPPSNRQHEAERSKIFSSVSWQQDDPVLLTEQSCGCPSVGKHG